MRSFLAVAHEYTEKTKDMDPSERKALLIPLLQEMYEEGMKHVRQEIIGALGIRVMEGNA